MELQLIFAVFLHSFYFAKNLLISCVESHCYRIVFIMFFSTYKHFLASSLIFWLIEEHRHSKILFMYFIVHVICFYVYFFLVLLHLVYFWDRIMLWNTNWLNRSSIINIYHTIELIFSFDSNLASNSIIDIHVCLSLIFVYTYIMRLR